MRKQSSHIPSQVTTTRVLEVAFGLTLTQEVQAFQRTLNWEVKHRGSKTACNYLKDLYTQAVALSLGLDPDPIPFRKSDRRGFCKGLNPFKKSLLSDDLNHKRAALTILRQCYLIYCDPVPDITSITSGANEDGLKSIVRSFIAFTREWVPPIDPAGVIKVIPRAKAGPNGPSSLMTSHLDAVALSQRPELLQSLHDLATCIDAESLGEPKSFKRTWIPEDCPEMSYLTQAEKAVEPEGSVTGLNTSDHLTLIRSQMGTDPWARGLKPWVLRTAAWTVSNFILDPKVNLPVSRLALLAEGGCKTRTIAIGDLFSQAILRPLHDKLMKRLRQLKQDCTFDQFKAISFLKEATLAGPVYSFDLTSATDRFPVLLQEIVMRTIFGSKVGSLWRKVMADQRDFSLKTSKTILNNVYYKRGQGMGLYSSWPAFAYTHHVLVQWCAAEVGVVPKRNVQRKRGLPFQDYRIIGDDVTIANREVATKYREILSLLEVPISMKKSIVSDKPPFCGEIAKRIIFNGSDISPIPAELIIQSKKQVTMLPALIDEIGRRYSLDYSTLSRLPSLAANFSRRKHKEMASILLSAPLAFALWGTHPLYGANTVKGDKLQEASALATLRQSPWVKVDPEVIPDIRLIQDQIRKVFILRQYEEVYSSWSFFDESDRALVGEVPQVCGPRAGKDKSQVTIGTQHPFWKACSWVNYELMGLFQLRVSSLEIGDEASMEDIGLHFCLDPELRSYKDRRRKVSQISSHLTLEVYKVLTGEKPYPEVEHPPGGLRTDLVRLTAH